MFYMILAWYSDLYLLTSVLLVIFLIIPYIILSFIAVWVYKDAKKKEINAAAWVLAVWIIPFFIGFVIYLHNRDKKVEEPS